MSRARFHGFGTFLAAILFAAAGLAQVVPGELADARAKHQAALATLCTNDNMESAALAAKYTNTLSALKASAQKAGDLDSLLIYSTELDRFAADPLKAAPAQPHALLARLAGQYRQLQQQQEARTAAETTRINREHDAALEALQKELTRQGRFDDATAVQLARKSPTPGAIVREPAAADVAGKNEVGWLSLFDGRTLDGWTGNARVWTVCDGAIRCTSGDENISSRLASTRRFTNFILRLRYMVAHPASNLNGAIWYRAVSTAGQFDRVRGLQYEMRNEQWGALKISGREAYFWKPAPAALAAHKPPGEWNDVEITADGPRIRHTINGIPAGEREKADPEMRSGHIALGYSARFKSFDLRFADIRIKPLP